MTLENQEDAFDSVDPILEEQEENLRAAAEKEQETQSQDNVPGEYADPESESEEEKTPEETESTEEVPVEDDATNSGDGGESGAAEDEFDTSLLADFNLTADQARVQFGTPEALRNAGRLLDQRVLQTFQQVAGYQNQNQALPRQPDGEVTNQQGHPQTPTPEDANEFRMPEPSDGEAWDEDVTRLVQSLNQHHAQQQAKLQKQLEEQRRVTEQFLREKQEVENRRYVDELDGFVNALGDEWTAVLGKGSGFELGAQSPFVTARAQLDAIAQQLANGRQLQGLPQLGRKQLLEKALPLAFPNIQQQAVRRQVEDELSKRDRMKTNRPTGRRQNERRTPGAAAASHAENWYAQRGLAPLPFDDVDYDEI